MLDMYKSIFAAFVATIVLSILFLIKNLLGILPQFDWITEINKFADTLRFPFIGWVIHFVIGTLFWGVFFAILSLIIPGPYWVKGLIFGILAWLLMMLIFMPSVNGGVFAFKLGFGVVILTLIFHLIHGIIMGWVYGLMAEGEPELSYKKS